MRFLPFVFIILLNHLVLSQTVDTNYVDGSVHFKLNDNSLLELDPYQNNVPALNLILTTYSVDTLFKPFKLPGTPLDKIYRIKFSNINSVNNLISDLELIPDVEFAEKIPLYRTTATPNDLQGNQWSLTKIMAEQAWDITTGSSNVVIAIVDNAVMHSHEDLIGNRWVNSVEQGGIGGFDDDLNGFTDDIYGYDVADGNNNPEPPGGTLNSSQFVHGTHVAGIASAATNNGTGIAALGYNCQIMSVKCSPNSSDGQVLTNAQDGVFYAMQAGADIISMSFGSSGGVLVSQLIVNQASAAGIVLIGAAGNDDSDAEYYPAAYSNVIAVGATDENDLRASFSNYGSWVDVMAPGTNIYSCLPESGNTYGSLQGTSMATPLVSGLAGLLLANNPGLSPSAVKSQIVQGCENIDAQNPNYAGQLGAGRINAFLSLSPNSVSQMGSTNFHIYPNPVSNGQGTRITFAGDFPNTLTIRILNYLGQSVYSKKLNNKAASEQLYPSLLPGHYLVEIQTDNHRSTQKLIVVQ